MGNNQLKVKYAPEEIFKMATSFKQYHQGRHCDSIITQRFWLNDNGLSVKNVSFHFLNVSAACVIILITHKTFIAVVDLTYKSLIKRKTVIYVFRMSSAFKLLSLFQEIFTPLSLISLTLSLFLPLLSWKNKIGDGCDFVMFLFTRACTYILNPYLPCCERML